MRTFGIHSRTLRSYTAIIRKILRMALLSSTLCKRHPLSISLASERLVPCYCGALAFLCICGYGSQPRLRPSLSGVTHTGRPLELSWPRTQCVRCYTHTRLSPVSLHTELVRCYTHGVAYQRTELVRCYTHGVAYRRTELVRCYTHGVALPTDRARPVLHTRDGVGHGPSWSEAVPTLHTRTGSGVQLSQPFGLLKVATNKQRHHD